jgi:hypothetical protein
LGSTLGSPRFIGGSVRRVVDGIFNNGVICATLQQECEEYAMGLLSFIHDTSASKIISFN